MDLEEEEVGNVVMVMKYLGELAYLVRGSNDNKPSCAVISRRIGTALGYLDMMPGSKPAYLYKVVLCNS